MKKLELTQDQRRILRCIEDNPGCCKRFIVARLEGYVGRKNVLNNITILTNEGMIIEKKGKQIYELYINKGDPVASLSSNIQNFDNAFSTLLGNVKIKLRELEKRKSKISIGGQRRKIDLIENELLHAIFDVYRWFVYQHDFLRNTNFFKDYDNDTSERLRLTVSDAIREIQAKLLYTFSKTYSIAKIDLAYLDLCNPFEDNIATYYLLKRVFDINKLGEYFEQVMDIMWKVSSNAPNFRYSRALEFFSLTISYSDINDWKKVLNAYEEVFENPLVVNIKYQQRKLMYDLPLLERQ